MYYSVVLLNILQSTPDNCIEPYQRGFYAIIRSYVITVFPYTYLRILRPYQRKYVYWGTCTQERILGLYMYVETATCAADEIPFLCRPATTYANIRITVLHVLYIIIVFSTLLSTSFQILCSRWYVIGLCTYAVLYCLFLISAVGVAQYVRALLLIILLQ